MSEQKTNYMAELDHWIEQSVIEPLYSAWQAAADGAEQESEFRTVRLIKQAIREKVLESYHNGQNAPQKRFLRATGPNTTGRRQYAGNH